MQPAINELHSTQSRRAICDPRALDTAPQTVFLAAPLEFGAAGSSSSLTRWRRVHLRRCPHRLLRKKTAATVAETAAPEETVMPEETVAPKRRSLPRRPQSLRRPGDAWQSPRCLRVTRRPASTSSTRPWAMAVTNRDLGVGGGTVLEGDFGVVYSRNLTPDATGISRVEPIRRWPTPSASASGRATGRLSSCPTSAPWSIKTFK
ncbi:MAG: hypothetical protein R3A10_12220 [Caldilineaceae bacterium]